MRRLEEDPDAPTGAAAGIAFGVTILAGLALLGGIFVVMILVGP